VRGEVNRKSSPRRDPRPSFANSVARMERNPGGPTGVNTAPGLRSAPSGLQQRGRRSAERRMPSIIRALNLVLPSRGGHRRGRGSAPNRARPPSGASPRHSLRLSPRNSAPEPRFPGPGSGGSFARLHLSQSSELLTDRSSCRTSGTPEPPGSGVTSPARRNRTRSVVRRVSRSRPSSERDACW
jgi:hypothetical protein